MKAVRQNLKDINSLSLRLSVLLIGIFVAFFSPMQSQAKSANSSAAKDEALEKNEASERDGPLGKAESISKQVSLNTNASGKDEESKEQINSAIGDLSKTDEIELLRSDFGVVTNRVGPTKDWKLHPIVVVPNLPGVQYAWKLKTSRTSPVFVREEFLLPEAPSVWKVKQGEGSNQLVNDGQGIVLESFQSTDDGWLGHAWTISLGDPSGRYQIKIWLNGKLFHTFIFNVGDAARIGRETRSY